MSQRDWLSDTRVSYDTVADNYTEFVRDGLAREPLLLGVLALFAERARAAGAGPVADIGCGPGFVTAHLRDAGLDMFGIDLSPAMIAIARRHHPDIRFEVGSMPDLALADGSVAGVVAFFSIIHVPDPEIPAVFARFHRALRPGGVALLGFHSGDRYRLKTDGYGGLPMRVHVYRRPVDRVATWLRGAGFAIDAQVVLEPDGDAPAGFVLARRPAG